MDALLAQRGYVDGRTAIFVRRFADGDFSRLPVLAAELADQRDHVIVAQTTTAAQAAKAVTPRIPIVVTSSGDAVDSGLVASLARPGGNVTGISFLGTELAVKQIKPIRELLPAASRIGFVANGRLDLPLDVRTAADVRLAILSAAAPRRALLAPPNIVTSANAELITALAAEHRLPVVYPFPGFARQGGFVAYGMEGTALFREADVYVDRILRGANPGELPVQQPKTLELVVNLRAARAQGVVIPPPSSPAPTR